jgi:hypothetical protein
LRSKGGLFSANVGADADVEENASTQQQGFVVLDDIMAEKNAETKGDRRILLRRAVDTPGWVWSPGAGMRSMDLFFLAFWLFPTRTYYVVGTCTT